MMMMFNDNDVVDDDNDDGVGYALHHGQLDIVALPAVTLPASGCNSSQQNCCNECTRRLEQ